MKWNWDPGQWKRSTKVLLAVVTVWPFVYMFLFIGVIFLFMLFVPFSQDRSGGDCGSLDLIQLRHKIQNSELKELTISRDEILAKDRVGNCEYRTYVSNQATREELLMEARKLDKSAVPAVPEIHERASPDISPAFPIGFMALFVAHLLTIFLIMGLMPLYIILAVKSDRLDQTTRIIWVVLLCMLGMLAMPVYWYLYIWREPSVNLAGESATQPPADNSSETS